MTERKISDFILRKRVFKPKIYEKLITQTILTVLPPYLDKNKLTVDVGGNTGHMAFFFSDHSKEVYTYEAVDVVYKQLKKIEGRKKNVKAFNLAVSDSIGKQTFYIDDKRLSNSSFLNLVEGIKTEVDVVSLDSLNLENVGFIKVDVEGTELDVLKGAINILKNQRPNCMLEIYKPYSKYPLGDIFDFMFDLNYKCFYYDHSVEGGLVEVKDTNEGINAVETMHHAHDGDFLFVS